MTRIFTLLGSIVATASLWANQPGGFTTLVTAPVTSGTVTYRGKTCHYVDNGILRAIFSPAGNVFSIRYLRPGMSVTPAVNGVEMFSQTASSSDGGFGNHRKSIISAGATTSFTDAGGLSGKAFYQVVLRP